MSENPKETAVGRLGGPLQIGWAATSITPDAPVNLFGMFDERISTHVEEPCTATVLAFEGADGAQAIWVSCDLCNITLNVVEALRTAVAARIRGFDPVKLLVSCTHTHNAPNFSTDLFPPPPSGVMSPDDYRRFFLQRVTDAVVSAWESRQPGQVASALGYAVLGWCRRTVYADGTGQMYGTTQSDNFVKIEGPMDPGVELLFTYDADGTITGALVSIVCTAQTCMGEKFLSADFWGPVRHNLRAHFGERFQVLAVVGAAGDQCPDDLIRSGRSEPRRRGLAGCNELARRLTTGVIDAYEHGCQQPCADPVFRHRHAVLDLPAYVMTAAETAHYEKVIADLTAKGEPDSGSWDGGTLLRARQHLKCHAALGPDPRLAIDCNFMRIGDLAVATNPFELYLEYGQRIKGRSPATQTITAQLTNDRASYLPTADALAHGHYSAMPSNIKTGPSGGDLLVEQSLAHLNALWTE